MKKLTALWVVLCLVLSGIGTVSAEEAALYSYEVLADGTARLTGCNDLGETVVLPAEIDGYKISEIGEMLFLRNGYVRTVVIPDGVRVIGAGAFQETRIEQVFLPEGLGVIDMQAFFACVELDRLVIPSTVTSIGEHAVGFGYYVDPAYPDLIPGAVGVREAFTLIADDNAYAEEYAASLGIACKTPADFPLGDTDYNGSANAADGRELLSNVLKGYVSRWTVSDMNRNGIADTSDVRLLLKALVLH